MNPAWRPAEQIAAMVIDLARQARRSKHEAFQFAKVGRMSWRSGLTG
jgi:hypothetical protein